MSWLCTFGLFQQLQFPGRRFIYVRGGGGWGGVGCCYQGNGSCWDWGGEWFWVGRPDAGSGGSQ